MNVRIKYMMAAMARHGRLLYVSAMTPFVPYIRSEMPITETIEDSLMTVTNSLPSAGRMFLMAWGRICF